MADIYRGPERRKFLRLDYITPLACKVCSPETVSKIFQGYTVNVSQAGLLCHIDARVSPKDIIWISFDRQTLSVCQDLEENCFIYQGGIIGKVVRVENRENGTHTVGVKFIIRQEQNLTYIYPKLHFLKDGVDHRIEEGEPDEDGEDIGDEDQEA